MTALCRTNPRWTGPKIKRAMCGAAKPIKAIEPTVLTAPPANNESEASARKRTCLTFTPK